MGVQGVARSDRLGEHRGGESGLCFTAASDLA